jgi:hypothetical protein
MISKLNFSFFLIFVVLSNQAFGFSFSNCGPNTDPFIVNLLSVQPDPIKTPGKYQIKTDIL